LSGIPQLSNVLRIAANVAHRVPPMCALPYPGDDVFWAIYQNR
jgi:hypothetical protein